MMKGLRVMGKRGLEEEKNILSDISRWGAITTNCKTGILLPRCSAGVIFWPSCWVLKDVSEVIFGSAVVQLPITPGNPRTSQHWILAYTARIASWHNWSHLANNYLVWLGISLVFERGQWIGTTWHFPCLCTRAVSWAHWAPPYRTWNHGCLESHLPGKCQNCTFWEVLELYSYCLNIVITSCGLWPGWKITDT